MAGQRGVDRGAEAMRRLQDLKSPVGAGISSDVNRTLDIYQSGLSDSVFVTVGLVVDSIPYANSYWVQYSGGIAPGPAVLGGHCSFTANGAREVACITPGTYVAVLKDKRSAFLPGIILCSYPTYQTDGRSSRGDFIHQASRSGLHVDSAHTAWTNLIGNGFVADFSAGRPVDQTTSGEWGAIMETGVRVIIDSFMAQIGINESTGLFAFYQDELLRLAGTNLQIWASGAELHAYDDSGEPYWVQGWSPYLWESFGLHARGSTATRTFGPEATQGAQAARAAVEPSYDDQMPFWRSRQFQGYLGQGSRFDMPLAPQEPSGGVHRYSQTNPWLSAAGHAYGLDGTYGQHSMSGIFLRKACPAPAPRPLKRPEDPRGDNTSNYSASGSNGSPSHRIKPDLTLPSVTNDDKGLVPAAAIADRLSLLFNWEQLHPFVYHTKDWGVPEESTLSDIVGEIPKVGFDRLKSQQNLEPPTPLKVRIDGRMQEVDVYPNESFVGMLREGGVVIGDGYGSTIVLAGGDITLSAANRIWLKSGKDTVIWGGHDVILRAKNSMDLTTTNKDFRVKSGNNIQIRAGNDDTETGGGILVESRSKNDKFDFNKGPGENTEQSGILLRAVRSRVITYGKDIYIRSGSSTGSGDTGFSGPGHIVLDAGNMDGNLEVRAVDVNLNFTNRLNAYAFTEGKKKGTKPFILDSTGLNLDGNLNVTETASVGKNMTIGDGLAVVSGTIGTSDGINSIGKMTSQSVRQYEKFLKEVRDSLAKLKGFYNAAQTRFQKEWYEGDNKPGSDAFIKSAIFSYRQELDYKTDNMAIYEDRWQQMARLDGTTVEKWEEKPVTANSKKTYPFPGEKVFEKDGYRIVDLKYRDADTRLSKDRGESGSAYQDAAYATPEKKPMKDYSVIL